tara:strand:- start:143583 stop:144311 length:729 start_codon:yes stop_codon:yes gene_type:complete
MKLITLNIWGGHLFEPLLDFFQRHQDVDVFCLQEVYHDAEKMITDEGREVHLDIFNRIQTVLPNHHGYFQACVDNIYGLAVFMHKRFDVIQSGYVDIYHNNAYTGIGPNHNRKLQWLTLQNHEKQYTIGNVHGLWNGKGKTDSPDRLHQADCIRAFIDTVTTPLILAGDFNLLPDTKSLHIIEENLNNLIYDYNITSTRTSYYEKPERFADYVLISKDISVKEFLVLPEEVSDHNALYLQSN